MALIQIDLDVLFLKGEIADAIALLRIEFSLLDRFGGRRCRPVAALETALKNTSARMYFTVLSLRGRGLPRRARRLPSRRRTRPSGILQSAAVALG